MSNTFYGWLLGPTMAYTCAVFPRRDLTLKKRRTRSLTWCRKLGPVRNATADIGAGWGGMARHAAKNYGVHVTAVTLSREQATWAQDMIRREGPSEFVDFRHGDYRDIRESGSMRCRRSTYGTHRQGQLRVPLRLPARQGDRGRPDPEPLHHPHDTKQPTMYRRGFVNRYIFPDGELVHVDI